MNAHRSDLTASLLLIGLLFACGVAHAQTRYVSDDLTITLRTGPSTQNAIIRNLTSGDSVQVLEEIEEEGYSRVRAGDGTEGWVISRYLQPVPTAALRLAEAERDLAAARQRVGSLEAEVAELGGSLQQSEAQLSEAQSSGASMSDELADIRSAAANAIAIRDQNESLRRRVAELSADVDLVAMENAELSSRNRQNWFIVGAAVLFGGVVIGLIAPSLRPRRRSSW
jgi:SH3 domain protein